jgi:hypothetical protein
MSPIRSFSIYCITHISSAWTVGVCIRVVSTTSIPIARCLNARLGALVTITSVPVITVIVTVIIAVIDISVTVAVIIDQVNDDVVISRLPKHVTWVAMVDSAPITKLAK